LSLFDYDLPPDRIAQTPAEPRDQARLLVLKRGTTDLADHHVHELPELLRPGDLLILNNTRVLAARLYGIREQTGGKWEGLFLRQLPDGRWELLCQTRGSPRSGEWIAIADGKLRLRLDEKTDAGHWLVQPNLAGEPEALLREHGHIPLPPYIRKGHDQPADRERYQTVFAQRAGAVAAPTAGLHFTSELLERLTRSGIPHAFVTLHVGVGTFQPIQVEDVTQHPMHEEWGELPEATAQAIRACRQRGGRVIAVGTTSVRVLETVAADDAKSAGWCGTTNLFIYPPYEFKLVDGLLTNFHLPRSSLLALVAAFTGLDQMQAAYRHAIAGGYRFYSYGDAMLVV
jgi:S-adenosylmethionine:tRNA ribosyltransferase-isomerase